MPILESAFCAAVAGFLTRPCCVIPAALSLAGVGSASLSTIFMTHRPWFLVASVLSLGVSAWLTLRRAGGLLNRCFTLVGSTVAFLISAGFIGALDVF
jgi:hypothetical protein